MILSKTNMQRVNLAMLMVCVSTVIVGSRVSASPAVTVLPDDAAKIIIYNAGSDGSPVENCQIPIEKLAVDFKNNEYGCVNDEAYSFGLKNVPSMTKIWLLSEHDCDLTNEDADWIFNAVTRNKKTSVNELYLKGLKANLDSKLNNPDKHVILAPGLELLGGQFVRNNIQGKLSCVRIEPATPDTTSSTGVLAQTEAAPKIAESTVSSATNIHASSYIQLWGSEGGDGKLDCTIPGWDAYTHRFSIWRDEHGNKKGPTNPQSCPNDDVYAIELVNMASGTLIYLSSEAACFMNREDDKTPDWIAKLKVTKKSTTTPRVEITALFESDVKPGKPLPVNLGAAGLMLVDKEYNTGETKGKLSCIQIIPPTPDTTHPAQ